MKDIPGVGFVWGCNWNYFWKQKIWKHESYHKTFRQWNVHQIDTWTTTPGASMSGICLANRALANKKSNNAQYMTLRLKNKNLEPPKLRFGKCSFSTVFFQASKLVFREQNLVVRTCVHWTMTYRTRAMKTRRHCQATLLPAVFSRPEQGKTA